jgi:hypothetical protein
MVEHILRHAMGKVAMRLQLHPQLERFRARLPYFLVPTVSTVLMLLPAACIVLLAQALGYRGTADMSLSQTWLTLVLLPPACAVVFAVVGVVGWVSGYRPFRRTWNSVPLSAVHDVSLQLQAAARSQGFKPVWHDAQTGQFVAVRNMELESQRRFNDGKIFPMRLSVFIRPTDPAHVAVELKLSNRTVVVWDSGERETCRQIGESFAGAA